MLIISPSNGMKQKEWSLTDIQRSSWKKKKRQTYFTFFSSVKVKYEMQATKEE